MQTQPDTWLDVVDDHGETPMTRALKSGNYSLTEIVLEYEKKCRCDSSVPLLHKAAHEGNDQLIDQLLESGADPDEPDDHGETALHKAVRQGHYTTVLTLLHAGALPNLRDGLGLSPMHWVALKGNAELVNLLYQFGADVNIRDSFGAMTPFTYARLLGYNDLARHLARFGGTW